MKSGVFSRATKSMSTVKTTTEIMDSDDLLGSCGVDCWDFAYPTGKCCLPARKNYASSKSRSKSKSKPRSRHQSLQNVVASSDDAELKNVLSSPEDGSQSPSSSFLSRRSKSKSSATTELMRTYLLSTPTPAAVMYPQTYMTLSTLLLTPHTQLILLVPHKYMMSPRVCQFSRLPRAGGCGIQILPLPDTAISMGFDACNTCGDASMDFDNAISDSDNKDQGQDQLGLVTAMADMVVDDVAKNIIKYTKARTFDGYLVFDENRDSWKFLESVGKGVRAAAAKQGSKR